MCASKKRRKISGKYRLPSSAKKREKWLKICRFIDLSLGVFFFSFQLPRSPFTARWENSTSYRMLHPAGKSKINQKLKPKTTSSDRKMRVPPCDLYPPDLGKSKEIDSLINHSLCCHKKEGKLTHCLVILWLGVLWDNVLGEAR